MLCADLKIINGGCLNVIYIKARLCLQRAASLRRHLKRFPTTSDVVLQHDQIQTDLPSSISDRSEYRDRQRSRGNALRARRLRQRRRNL